MVRPLPLLLLLMLLAGLPAAVERQRVRIAAQNPDGQHDEHKQNNGATDREHDGGRAEPAVGHAVAGLVDATDNGGVRSGCGGHVMATAEVHVIGGHAVFFEGAGAAVDAVAAGAVVVEADLLLVRQTVDVAAVRVDCGGDVLCEWTTEMVDG